MRLTFASVLPLVAVATCQTVYLAGDSTMAKYSDTQQGWGVFFGNYLNIPVKNLAVGGTSSRSYTESGLFNTLISQVKAGDFVVLEFGHNDVSAGAVDNGKQTAVGDGYDITATVKTANGSSIVIHSFAYYIENAITAIVDKGATPVISSLTSTNDWANGKIVTGSRFVDYAKSIGIRKGIVYIDHNGYGGQAFTVLGQSVTNTMYPNDHLHTNSAGAKVQAEAFVRGLLCSSSTLKSKVNSAGQAVPNGCL
ncbi:rhamnogalacturonan acetylesterase [Moniliophthora roreri MCA 2997]|uniref:Rhamnogalacturonan acetylesterase n=1 Tax=Moniliophthora roreri (strain MCA 2997) TaxID=1381753 RepID=V2XEH4_MONRO|nr:rhamnogalacturonan acetylesterase [Moniliophthora roreri MCA 2997]